MTDQITPGTPATPLVTVTLPDGRWLRLHVASINQQLAIAGHENLSNDNAAFWLVELRKSIDETSWSGDIGDGLGMTEFLPLVNLWLAATEDVALPKPSGSSSLQKSPEAGSHKPTAAQPRRQRSRRSSSS